MKKILIIEEDAIVSKIFQSRLQKELGAEVGTAADPEEGLRKIEENNPDLVFLDMFLNNQETLPLLREIKKNNKISEIPIVMITVIGDKENMEEAKRLGVRSFIVKGVTALDEVVEVAKREVK